MEASRSRVAAAQSALTRMRTLNADDKNVSDRAVQEAEARVAAEQAKTERRAAKRATADCGAGHRTANASLPLEITRGGMVVEVMAHPGESVEAGQPLLRMARFDKLLARVDVPAGETVASNLTSASIVPLGVDDRPLNGERVGFAASVDPKTQGQPFVFRVADALVHCARGFP